MYLLDKIKRMNVCMIKYCIFSGKKFTYLLNIKDYSIL